jgi:hypothetical protein
MKIYHPFIFLFSFLTIIASTVVSCRKDDETHGQTTVAILSPAAGIALNEQDTVWIKAELSSEDNLHEFSVSVKNLSDGTNAYTYNGHSHDKQASVNVYYLPSVDADSDMELTVTAMDHNGNKVSKTVVFRVLNTIAALRPVVTITSPAQEMFDNGAVVSLKGTVQHTINLAEARVTLQQNGVTVLACDLDAAGKPSCSFDTTYRIDITQSATFSLSVVAKDVNGLQGGRTADFHVHY